LERSRDSTLLIATHEPGRFGWRTQEIALDRASVQPQVLQLQAATT
jgi:hypothetical protein